MLSHFINQIDGRKSWTHHILIRQGRCHLYLENKSCLPVSLSRVPSRVPCSTRLIWRVLAVEMLRTQVEGPKSEGMSGFGVFLRIVAILAAFYLIAGAAYNHYMYGAKGMDLIPHIGNDHGHL